MARRKRKEVAMEDDHTSNDEGSGEDIIEDGPPIIDPYKVLGLEKETTADDVKKAYRKLALQHHPDKAPEDQKDTANKTFQEIAFAYAVLSDDRRRKRYDLTGSTAETLEDDEEFDWLKFYREQWENVVNEEAIKKVSGEYKNSAEERRDLIKAYKTAKGKLNHVYELVMLSDILEDDERFRETLDEEIAKGTIESYPAYAKETDASREKAKQAERKRREDFEKEQAKEAAKEGKAAKSKKQAAGSMSDLAAMIQSRQKARAGKIWDNLEAKYAPKSRGSKRSTPMEEPPEEAFQATAARKKQKQKKSKDEDEAMVSGEDVIGGSEDEQSEEDMVKKRKAKPRAKAKRDERKGTKA